MYRGHLVFDGDGEGRGVAVVRAVEEPGSVGKRPGGREVRSEVGVFQA